MSPIGTGCPRPAACATSRRLIAALSLASAAGASGLTACAGRPSRPPSAVAAARIVPGITVLLEDSLELVRGKRVGLLTNQTGVDPSGISDAALLGPSSSAARAGVRLTALFSPEHGLRGNVDRQFVGDDTDTVTGLPVYSLYGATVLAPPDSVLQRLDVLVIDLQDVGSRTWTYVASVVYAMRAAAHHGVRVVVLDRPNPITGAHVEGPVLDSALADAEVDAPGRPARPFALGSIPLRHGLTMGELARYYNAVLGLGADLHVVQVRGWRRALWFDETGLPWVRPSPNLPSLASVLLYPALVSFEGSNLSVGRGTPNAFQQLGAPWLDASHVVAMIAERGLRGVRFESDSFLPVEPTDGKYGGRRIPGVRVVVTDRDRVETTRVAATLLWAVARANGSALRLDTAAFDLRFGSPAARAALLRGDDPDAVIDRMRPDLVAFERARRYTLYH